MRCVLVSHFHWDREWYRTFEDFRSRLVGAIDAVLDHCARDPGYRFVLDGQAIVLDDYLELRPDRRPEIETRVREGRLAIGPWYVQPDSLLPSGEAHVRNLLRGRATAASFGPVARTAYVPDSFGHPAQFPQLLAGFGLGPFVYWRGNGDELDRLGPLWRWRAPDGTEIGAWHLSEGYFAAAALDADPDIAAERLHKTVERLAAAGQDPVLLMNGFDHLPADAHTAAVAEALARRLDAPVTRALLDDAAALLDTRAASVYEGPLLGGRTTNLLPGVWSARLPLKLRNRECETELVGWAEPWAALGAVLGLADERPALRTAWHSLLQNQAHDSLGGCSLDRVHEQMHARFDSACEVARTTTRRVLEQLAGRATTGMDDWTGEPDVVVFNPSPHAKSGVVRLPLDPFPPWRVSIDRFDLHPLALAGADHGVAVDGVAARVVPSSDPSRVRFLPGTRPVDVEFVAARVPAFGCRSYRLRRGPTAPDATDREPTVSNGAITVHADGDGTLTVSFDGREYRGLFGVEDRGDRGDSYDFDPVDEGGELRAPAADVWRTIAPGGIQRLCVRRPLLVPVGLDDSRERRSDRHVECTLTLDAVVAPGIPWVEVEVGFDNRARDHRLRALFPTGAPVETFRAETTFDVARRTTELVDASRWVHPAPSTFPHQGWVAANGLVVGAPGLPEAEVSPAGTIFVTLVRSVAWLSRFDLRTRPVPAGPEMAAPGAQVPGSIGARVVLARDPEAVCDAELGLRAVVAGPAPRLADGASLVSLLPRALVLSACKPADDGDGIVVRVLNPTDDDHEAALALGFPVRDVVACRLDETAERGDVVRDANLVRFPVPAHALRTVRIVPGPPPAGD